MSRDKYPKPEVDRKDINYFLPSYIEISYAIDKIYDWRI